MFIVAHLAHIIHAAYIATGSISRYRRAYRKCVASRSDHTHIASTPDTHTILSDGELRRVSTVRVGQKRRELTHKKNVIASYSIAVTDTVVETSMVSTYKTKYRSSNPAIFFRIEYTYRYFVLYQYFHGIPWYPGR